MLIKLYLIIKSKKLFEIDLKNSSPGDIIFFSNNESVCHVGFYCGNDEIIHSSGFVKKESFNPKKANFSEKIKVMFYKALSIDNFIN